MKSSKVIVFFGVLIFIFLLGIGALKYNSLDKRESMSSAPTQIDAAISKTGQTRLLDAIKQGDVEGVSLLLKEGASTSVPERSLPLDDAIGWTAGFMFELVGNSAEKAENQKRIIALLADAKAPTTYPEIFVTVLRGDLDVLKEMIKRGDLKKLTTTQMHKLPQLAVRSNNKEIVEYLKREIPNFVSLNPDRSLLQLALDNPYYSMIEYVLSFPETNVNAKGANEDTPLHDAINSFINPSKIKTIKALLAKGAHINALGYRGKTPLDDADSMGDQEIIKLLIDNGAKRSADLKG